jgi:hypothetical protein
MKYLPLLGKHLKDDDVIDVLEWADVEVVYDFDRTHENIPDRYWASAKTKGLQLGFDENQTLEAIFLYAVSLDGFSAVDREDCDVRFFSSIAEVERQGVIEGVPVVKGKAELLGVRREWARLEYRSHTLHYEFTGGGLSMVTASNAR